MTFGFGLGAALRGLNAARQGLQTAGNNISNANTPGYSRQRVDLVAAQPYTIGSGLQIGAGVDVRSITRIVDEGLERRLQMQLGLVGSAELEWTRYREIESVFSEPEDGLSSSYKDLFSAVDQLRTDPSDRALRGGLIQSAGALGNGFRLLSERLSELSGSTFEEVRGLIRQVNQRAAAVAALNNQIVSAEANGSDANDLRDTRASHIRELSKLIDVRPVERSAGSIDLLVGGSLLVAGDRTTELSTTKNAADSTVVSIGQNKATVQIREGRIGALLQQESGAVPGVLGRLDDLARNTILEWNRIHSTGMPGSGPFRSLTAAYGVVDGDGDGERGDELLSQSGFPFAVQNGELHIAVTSASGELRRTKINIDPSAMTLRDVASAISDIDNLTASVDPTGRLQISADDGFGFDFSTRLDTNPDDAGTFGGKSPSIGSNRNGPFDLSGQTFPVSFQVSTGAVASPTVTTVTLAATDFVNSGAATVEELVQAINADLGAAGTAMAVGGRLVIQSSEGANSARLQLTNVGAGTALTALGLSTAAANGRDNPVTVQVEGTYNGSANELFTFEPETDGIIGQTQDLRVRVIDSKGKLVTTLNVGSDYEPGSPLALGNGVRVAFGAGSISQTAGNVFALEALADGDTADLLVATGTNAFFIGSSAADIAVNPDLVGNPDRLAAGIGAADGDAGNLARLVELRQRDIAALGTNTIEDFYADIVGDIGFSTAGASSALEAQGALLAQLAADREALSGVNLDEEAVDLTRFQQAYEAAARFLSVAQEMTDTLINLAR